MDAPTSCETRLLKMQRCEPLPRPSLQPRVPSSIGEEGSSITAPPRPGGAGPSCKRLCQCVCARLSITISVRDTGAMRDDPVSRAGSGLSWFWPWRGGRSRMAFTCRRRSPMASRRCTSAAGCAEAAAARAPASKKVACPSKKVASRLCLLPPGHPRVSRLPHDVPDPPVGNITKKERGRRGMTSEAAKPQQQPQLGTKRYVRAAGSPSSRSLQLTQALHPAETCQPQLTS